jgi:peptidyl-prolyl cis-trans isomerase C
MSINKRLRIAVCGFALLALTAGGTFVMSTKGEAEDQKPAAAPAAAAAAGATTPVNGADLASKIKPGNPVVATVNGKDITRSDVLSFISNLPEQVRQMPLENLFSLAQDQVINNELVNEKAKAAKLDGDPEVEKLTVQAKEQIVRGVYMDRELAKAVTEDKTRKAYATYVAGMGDVQETKARHILVDSEAKAKEVIAKLKGGAKFEDVAKEYSKGPSGQNGGELGWFAKNEMVPEFANAAFALGKGEVSKTPVKTQFGWHVIQVEDRRQRPVPDYDSVKPQVEAKLRQEALNDILAAWNKDAKIKKLDINGDPIVAKPAADKKK